MKNRTERGQTLVIFALALVGLLAFVALAIDIGRLYIERRNAQSAADSAAFAAAIVKIRKEDSLPLDQLKTAIANAAIAAAQNDGFPASTVTTHYPPVRPGKPYDGDASYIQVIIQSSFNTFFVHIFGRTLIENTSEAVVMADSNASYLGDDLIWAANATSGSALTTNGGTNEALFDGNVYVASSAADAFRTVGASGSMDVTDGSIFVHGGANTGTTSITPAPITGVPYKQYPEIPAPDCKDPSNFQAGHYFTYKGYPDKPKSKDDTVIVDADTELQPGVYYNILAKSHTLTLYPGVYCILGNFTVKGNIQNGGALDVYGNAIPENVAPYGVILVFTHITDSKGAKLGGGGILDLGGSANVYLTAPQPALPVAPKTQPGYYLNSVNGTSVSYAGMLIYANPDDYSSPTGPLSPSNTFQLNGNVNTKIVGTMYIPTADCSLQGNSGIASVGTQVICNRVSLGGGGAQAVNLNMSLDTSNPFKYGGNIRLMQ